MAQKHGKKGDNLKSLEENLGEIITFLWIIFIVLITGILSILANLNIFGFFIVLLTTSIIILFALLIDRAIENARKNN